MRRILLSVALLGLIGFPACAEVISSSPRQFELRHVIEFEGSPQQAWRRLLNVKTWWSEDHTYSGNAANLRLSARPGGCWCERWQGGGAEHARVIYIADRKTLRLDGAFGPLQAMATKGIMSFSLTPSANAGNTTITLTYLVNGVPESKLDQIAPEVDGMLGEQAARLAGDRQPPRQGPAARMLARMSRGQAPQTGDKPRI
jgi:hypothetical protein